MKSLFKHLPVLVLTIGLALFLSACTKPASTQDQLAVEEFAKCLTDNGAKFYGAYWCPHCADQKAMFGKSIGLVTYVECSLPGGAGQTEACTTANIKAYPTWEFKDGTRQEGVLSFSTLAQKSGCPEPGKEPTTAGPAATT